MEVKVRVNGNRLRTKFGVRRQAISAPTKLPKKKESTVAISSKPNVHGNAWTTNSSTRLGKEASEKPKSKVSTLRR